MKVISIPVEVFAVLTITKASAESLLGLRGLELIYPANASYFSTSFAQTNPNFYNAGILPDIPVGSYVLVYHNYKIYVAKVTADGFKRITDLYSAPLKCLSTDLINTIKSYTAYLTILIE